MAKGGMQTSAVKELICECGKPTSKILEFTNGTKMSIHFTRKSTYWHITDKNGKTRRTFKKPEGWF